MDQQKKREVAGWLAEYPLLRVLLFETWFRVGFALFLAVLIGGLVALPKIWVTSPDGFLPVVKVSLLDFVQAWSLQRSARLNEAAGKFDEANYAWQVAFANNQADASSIRGLLRNYLNHERHLSEVRNAAPLAFWLLRLTQTNVADLEIAAEVLERRGLVEYVPGLIAPSESRLTPALEKLYLKALFETGNHAGFNARWERVESKIASDPELALYRAAYLAAYAPAVLSADAMITLEKGVEDPGVRALATRLRMAISAQRGNLVEYEGYLTRLAEWRADQLVQHVTYWRLLLANGRRDLALKKASDYPYPPGSPQETIELATFYSLAGQPDAAIELFRRYARDFAFSAPFWIAYGQELIAGQRWPELREVAVMIRSVDGIADTLAGYSHFMEGRAELGLGRAELARAAFAKMLERGFDNPPLAFRAAADLISIRQPAPALALLQPLEAELSGEINYWMLVFNAAHLSRDAELMLRAARTAYELQPGNAVAINNYAAVLLIERANPEEAARLTFQLFSQAPLALAPRVNHAAALLLNNRVTEARELLASVNPQALTPEQLNMFQLDLCEVACKENDRAEARRLCGQVDATLLFPKQAAWLADALARLEADEARP